MSVNQIIEQTVTGLGYELVSIEFSPDKMIRIFMDKEGGVTIEDCEAVSSHLSKLFLVEDIDYNRLEVSSPGIERPLNKPQDFKRSVGKLAKIKVKEPINGNKLFKGLIVDANLNTVLLGQDENLSGEALVIELANISSARLVFEFQKNLASNSKKKLKKG